MRKKTIRRLLVTALCITLAGCGVKDGTPVPSPAPEPSAPVQEAVQPNPIPEPDTAPEPDTVPQDVQPVEPALPAPEEEAGSIADSYMGTWRDDARGTSGGRCSMRIDCEDGVNYDISIFWGSSSATARYWWLTGIYDETQEGIVYTGIQFYGWTQDDGSVERSEETEDEEGLIRLENGVLYWEDTVNHNGDGMWFNKES